LSTPHNLNERLERLLSSGTDNALLRFSLGQTYLNAGSPEKAAKHLRRATEHDPDYSAAWKLLGRALADAGRPGEAVAAFERGIAIAEARGDYQAAKEMHVFLRRLTKQG